MKKILFGVLMLLLLSFIACSDDDESSEVTPPTPPVKPIEIVGVNDRVVVAYVPWYTYAENRSWPDPNAMTHIIYAFAELYINGLGEYTGFKLQGKEERFATIVDLKKQNPKLKISIAFSHIVENSDNRQAGGFSLLSKSDVYRKAFAKDCKAFLQKWGIDGIDMDWEFPGISWSGHASDPLVDVQNHILLMKQLRETLGDQYLLTFAGYIKDKQPVTEGGYKYIDIKAVEPYVDFINLMTYDISEAPRHQSALDDPSSYWDCNRTVQAYLRAGVPANKLVLGIPFYGRRSFSVSPTAINYNKIILLDPNEYKIDNWDDKASVPYVTRNGEYYCGYDNARSIAIKGDWAIKKGMRGMMFWDYNSDDVEGTLRKAVKEAVMKE